MSTNRAIAHNTAIQLIGKVLSVFLGLIAMGLLMRYLQEERFGWYITAISFLQFIGILIDFGLIPVTAQLISERPDDKKLILNNVMGLRIITATILLSFAPVVALFFPYPTEVKLAIAISSIAFFSICLNQVMIAYYQNKLAMHVPVIGELLSRVALVGGLFLGVFYSVSFLWLMAIITMASCVYTLTMYIGMRRDGFTGTAYDTKIWKLIFQRSWPVTVAVIFNVLYLKGDTILLSLFRSQTEVGIYGAAYRVIDILAQTAMMIMGIMLPLLSMAWAKRLTDEFHNRLMQSIHMMALFALPMTAGLIMLGPKIIRLVGGDQFDYASSGRILQILSLAVLGVFIGGIFGHVAVATNTQKKTLWIYALSAVLTVSGYLFFIPRFGIFGAAWMSVFSELCTGFLLCFTVLRLNREKLEYKTLSKLLFATGCMAMVIYATKDTLPLLLIVPMAIMIYGLLLIVTNAISKETITDILLIKNKKI